MASETMKLKSRAQRYVSLVELLRPVNTDTWTNQKGILRLALSNTPLPSDAHDVDVLAKRMQRPVDDFSAADKVRILWLAFADEDAMMPSNLAPVDDDAEKFNAFFYQAPMKALLHGIDAVEHAALRKTMQADTRTPRHDLTAIQALDTIFGTDSDSDGDPRPVPGMALAARVLGVA